MGSSSPISGCKIQESLSCHHLETGYQWASPAIPFHLALQTSHNLCLNFCGCHSQLLLSLLLGFLILLCVRKLPAWFEAQQNQAQTAEKSWIIRNDLKIIWNCKHFLTLCLSGWWLNQPNPFEKYESKWVHLPQFFGVKIPNIYELPPPSYINQL